jgi:polyisoprenoid-binding protein YceI
MGINAAVFAAAGTIIMGGLMVGTMPSTTPSSVISEAASQAESYGVDGLHSSVVFKLGYMGVTNFYGRFNEVSGEYVIDLDSPSNSMLEISVKANSVDSNSENRDKHLKGGDFFSAQEFPEISFVGQTFEAAGDHTLKVTGELTLKGVTKTESTILEWMGDRADPRGGQRSGWEAKIFINRSDYGVDYGIENGALGDGVELTVAITGMQK